jgi:hypothetical protein
LTVRFARLEAVDPTSRALGRPVSLLGLEAVEARISHR